ncbi:uncharacterized protein LOC116297059 isoform X2 [Actinia tenebrosa]|uniref:Uncharacterized protein LOC116297059 isoform X2 n=1 Tax=Actinia tenebrosa TaxID=6105 RepID=A0A6P8I8T4_ACTTE|nr:uncharacterized protein LOC116297059 isoform X2 [Actinia tenebrosa]XP_031561066.1 uncharacterized protein LOC116297059 isoform X2 [Actinia tenebrosa]
MDTKKSSYAKEDNENEDKEWARLIERKKEELKQLREKEETLCQRELHYQREKEALLTQYKQVFPDKPDWSRKNSTSVDPNNSADNRHQDVFKVGCQIHQQKKQEKLELQLREKQARKMLAEVDDALKMEKKGFGLETPLLKWYLKIKNYIKMDEEEDNENIPESEKSLCMADRMFYQVKYQTKDGNHPQWNMPLGKQQYQSLPGKWLEELSFSTRQKGTCVHVTITRKVSNSCSSKSPLDANNCFEESEPFFFSTDPYVTDCHERGLELLLQNDQPEKFIKDVVWNYIDTETS